MKSPIRPYIRFLLKQHLLYFLLMFVLLVITILLPKLSISKLSENQSKVNALKAEVSSLEAKVSLLNIMSSMDRETINRDIGYLETLVPDAEDYFSIITTLEELTKKTGFLITSYNIPALSKQSDKLTLEITGIGDSEAFLNFLDNK